MSARPSLATIASALVVAVVIPSCATPGPQDPALDAGSGKNAAVAAMDTLPGQVPDLGTVAAGPCGDGNCDQSKGESLSNCSIDCRACGDQICSPGEGPLSCPEDCCGACGDGVCRGFSCGESLQSCPKDCGTACGNKLCDPGENPQSCAEDCKWQVCGNKVCEPGDGGPVACPGDCGTACGNCQCEKGENGQTCPVDCGECGDGVCSNCPVVGELALGCSVDCKAGVQVGAGGLTADPVKIDFLWVIDHSTSMAQEQRGLALGFATFINALKAQGEVDAQMAVVTVQQIADKGPDPYVAVVGRFMHQAATALPPSARERIHVPCATDADCAMPEFSYTFDKVTAASLCPAVAGQPKLFSNPLAGPSWRCAAPGLAKFTVNDNCSVNAYCWPNCASDADCRSLFEPNVPAAQQSIRCLTPGGGPMSSTSACQFPPLTEGCPPPGGLPDVIGSSQLDLFRCLASVASTSQTLEAAFEGGLRSAWWALDPNGPNCPKSADGKPGPTCQYQRLVRPDAWLVIAFVTDDDDCSAEAGVSLENATPEQAAALKALIPDEKRVTCQRLRDRLGNNVCASQGANPAPAEPWLSVVEDWVPKFKTLKADPNRLFIGVFTGRSQAADPKQQAIDHEEYCASLRKNVGAGQAPYVCMGARGEAGYGSRYLSFANAFGKNGISANLCDDASLVPALVGLAKSVVKAAKHADPPK